MKYQSGGLGKEIKRREGIRGGKWQGGWERVRAKIEHVAD